MHTGPCELGTGSIFFKKFNALVCESIRVVVVGVGSVANVISSGGSDEFICTTVPTSGDSARTAGEPDSSATTIASADAIIADAARTPGKIYKKQTVPRNLDLSVLESNLSIRVPV